MSDSITTEREIIYVGDPMCGWCWGFAPVARRLAERFGAQAQFRIIAGGLRPGEHAATLDASLKQTIRPQWEQVEAMTSQPFNYSFFERDDFLFDTGPACQAVVCARRLDPMRTLDVFIALQTAFFQHGRDITDADVIADVIADQGFDRAQFIASFARPATLQYTYADFAMTSRLGAQGFPAVFLRNRDDVALLTMGFQALEALEPAVERYFRADPAVQPAPEPPAPV
jgi:putative protein-disulfide isomerase